MKDKWRKDYGKVLDQDLKLSSSVLTAFNANIDKVVNFEDLEWDLNDTTPDGDIENVETLEEVKKVLKYCITNGENLEVNSKDFEHDFEGEKSIGGQAGIIANFLSNIETSVTFYTPFLSEELSEEINERVLHPVYEEEFMLKSVRDAANADRTKENIIIEFNDESSGRLILSDKLRGFGPYFRSGIEENLGLINKDIEKAILSGFHDADGNFKPKIDKSVKQIEKIDKPIHLEIAACNKEKYKYILDKTSEKVESIGLDKTEAKKALNLFDKDIEDKLKVDDAFELGKILIERSEIRRVHIHTYRFHILVADKDYSLSLENIKDSLLFGEASAILSAEKGRIPDKEDFLEGPEFDKIHVKNLDALEEFAEEKGLQDFVAEGFSMVEGFKLAAIPPLIHEEPERLVGLGDLISAGAFVYEPRD